MAPRFFGQHREIFGWHHEGAAPTRRLGVVLCNSHGEEYLCSHRTIRSLAGRLQAMGFPTLRFDYHGTGDSLGSDRDPQRVRAWTQSVHAAIDELRRASGVDGVVLFGFRLGAALAMMAAAERDDVRALALWSPCARGRAFLRERRALHAVASVEHWDDKEAPAVRGPDDDETVGFFLSSETIADLQGLDVTKLARRPADRILIVGRDGSPIEPGLAERMRDLGAAVDIRAADGFAGMMLPPHLSVIPTQVIDAVTSWTADLAPVDGA